VGAAERFGAILRVILLDCSIAILLHERAAQERIDARRTSVEENVQSFGGTADRVCAEIHTGASRLINGAESLSLAMTRAHESTEGATHASAHVSGAMQQTVLAAAALENTLFEIRTDAKLSAKASVVTAEKTDLADTCVKELLTCAAQIGSVTDVISSIASQTSLLALNATIEAARAGAAGRSFAVVAGEVKELAGRTAQATLEVGEHIQRIQDAARRSVEALEEVSARIAEQRDLCQRIEAAVVDQTSSTGQIREEAGVVAEAASATLAAITSIQDTVADARSAFEDTRMWATEMSVASDGLAVEFRDFASRLRRA
jgi:methyl-accepting chemotaxis protein